MLAAAYPWIKAFHVMAVIAWMAGLFYLPRLYVYHAERHAAGAEPTTSFEIMEGKLLQVIMRPAMIATWSAGLLLVATPGIVDWSSLWPWAKAAGVIAMTAFHGWCAAERRRRDFRGDCANFGRRARFAVAGTDCASLSLGPPARRLTHARPADRSRSRPGRPRRRGPGRDRSVGRAPVSDLRRRRGGGL